MFPVLPIGPIALPAPSLAILVGLWLGLSLSEKHAPRFGIKASYLYNLVMLMLLTGILGARLAFIIRFPVAFSDNLASVVSLNLGLLDPIGGLFFAILAGSIYGKRKGLPFWSTLDALTPMLATFMVALGLSHLASGAAFGAPTNLPWGIDLWGTRRHPSQVYELAAATLILALLWPEHYLRRLHQPGEYFLTFLAASAGSRLFLEAFRGDSQLIFFGLRSAQAFSWVILAISLLVLYWLRRRLPEGVRTNL
jgi:phosphatidylglycerol---prolipoprotein diacylglyceryl transferase